MRAHHLIALLALCATPSLAVVTSGNQEAERREASLDTGYGVPAAPIAELVLPAAIYGQPATHTYPAPPPDLPPPPPSHQQQQQPHKEYGVPVQQYGPPALHVEYGPPAGGDHHHHQHSEHHHQHDQHQHQQQHQQTDVSFFDQVKQHFGIPKAVYGAPAPVYGPPKQQQHPHTVYGPPQRPQRPPKPVYGPPTQHLVYGPPKPNYNKPKPVYGPPKQQYGPPKQHHHPAPVYGPPPSYINKRPSKPQHVYGPPPQQQQQQHHHQHNNPAPVYGPPPSRPVVVHQPAAQYGPPQQQQPQLIQAIPNFSALPLVADHHQSSSSISSVSGSSHGSHSGPPPPTGSRCEGWRPIAGPAIPYSNSEQQIHLQQSSGDLSFGAELQLPQQEYAASSASGGGIVAESSSGGHIDGGLQLPVNGAINFYHDTAAGLHGGKHGGQQQVVEVQSNHIHATYGVPAEYAQAPQQQQQHHQHHHNQQQQHHHSQQQTQHYSAGPSSGLIPPSGVYGVPPGGSYTGLALQHGAVSGNLQNYPSLSIAPPTHPVQFREPVPQGLLESIGHSVQQQDSFGGSHSYSSSSSSSSSGQQHGQQASIYISPPASDIPPPPQGLESLPLDQGAAQLFHPHIDSVQALPYNSGGSHFGGSGAGNGGGHISAGNLGVSDCGHGPAFVGQDGASFQVSSGYEAAKSSASSYETQSQTVAEFTQSGYEQPSGGESLLNVIQVNDEHSPTSSYGPPPSGIPNEHQHQHSSTLLISGGDESHAHSEALSGQAATQNVQIVTAVSAESQERAQQHQQQLQAEQHSVHQQVSVESQQQQIQEAFTHHEHSIVHDQQHYQQQHQQLPGLDGAGLDIVSAQKSHSLTIPVHGNHGTYQLQFQSADPLGHHHHHADGINNDLDAPNHQQILSDGLLQQILSAIEQPDGKSGAVPQVSGSSYEELDARSDVDQFIKSQIGQQALSEPKIQ